MWNTRRSVLSTGLVRGGGHLHFEVLWCYGKHRVVLQCVVIWEHMGGYKDTAQAQTSKHVNGRRMALKCRIGLNKFKPVLAARGHVHVLEHIRKTNRVAATLALNATQRKASVWDVHGR